MTQGMLILVVGPSGAGKDTLIDGARRALAGDPGFHFPRREITRPADAGGEDHLPVSVAAFEARRRAGRYVLSWGAHGLHYGVPRDIEGEVAEGRRVVVNVSRGVIGEARERFPSLRIVEVTVPPAILEARLKARGRESDADIARRLARAAAFELVGDDVARFANDRPPAESIAAFVDVLRA